jgi:hypothetical protein
MFKNLFGKGKKEEQKASSETELPWIHAQDNPWRVELLDLRPFTQHMLSSSPDPKMAENAISYGGEDGTTFFGQRPESNRVIKVNISLPIDKRLEPGVLFTPNTMEHKWAIYFDGEFLIFIRSWLREVVVVAKTTQNNERLYVEEITGEFTKNESPEFTAAVLNYLLISHSIGEIVPAPLPKELESNTKDAASWAFSLYGNMVHVGVFDEMFISSPKEPLRSHSLLHIAVARGELKKIELYAQNGMDLNALAGDGLAPLHWSVAPETTDSMKKLLELGANPNARTHEGATPLMNAVQSNKIDKLNLLLESGAEVNAIDNRGFTGLHRAAEMGHTEIVRILLENGADKTISAEGHTAVSLATMTERPDIIKLLTDL